VNTSVRRVGALDDEMLTGILKSLTERRSKISLMEISFTVRVFSDVLKSPVLIQPFVTEFMREWRNASLVYENFHTAHLRFFSSIPDNSSVGGYAMDEEGIITASLKFERPSRVLSGLCQLSMAIYAMTDTKSFRIMRNLSLVIIETFSRFWSIPGVVGWKINLINRWLLAPIYQSFHQILCHALVRTFSIPLSSPWFCESLSWIPTAVRAGINCSSFLSPSFFSHKSKINQFFRWQ
jgi:hypothetical protein